VSLGVFVHVVDLPLSDFAFTYIAVAISIALYAVTSLTTKLIGRIRKAGDTYELRVPYRVLLTGVMSLFVSIALVFSYEKDYVIRSVRAMAPRAILKSSQRQPMVAMIGADADQTLHLRDERPVTFRIATEAGSIAQYNLYLRVRLSENEQYEGRPARFSTGKDSTGFPLVLSPACRVTSDPTTKSERFGRIFGPGVYVTDKDVKVIELYEMKASGCWRCFYSPSTPLNTKCFDVKSMD